MKNVHNLLFKVSLIVLVSLSLIVISGLFNFPFRVHQSLNGKREIHNSGYFIDSANEVFVGIDKINEEISNIMKGQPSDIFFKMKPVLKKDSVNLNNQSY